MALNRRRSPVAAPEVAVETPAGNDRPDPKKLTAEERKSLTELYGKALEGFDKTIVTTASGSLVLSVTFLHDIAPNPPPGSWTTLWLGWCFLVLSLAVMILSMLSGQRALEAALAETEDKTSVFTTLTTGLNLTSAIFLILGLVGLAWFAASNVFAPKPMSSNAPTPCASVRF